MRLVILFSPNANEIQRFKGRMMTVETWDFAVIGGGVAGSATAIALGQRGWRVGLIEQSSFDKPRVGEVVSHAILLWLRDHLCLDLFQRPQVLRSPVRFEVHWGQHATDPQTQPATHMRIDRTALDRCLFEHARQQGIVGLSGANLRNVVWNDRSWELQIQVAGECRLVRANFVMEATGRTRFSPVCANRRRLYEDQSIACAMRLPPVFPTSLDRVWIESQADGWWYVSQLPGSECLVVFFTDRDLLPKQSLQRQEWLEDRWRATAARREAFRNVRLGDYADTQWTRHDARMSLRQKAFGRAWMAVGDAQMALDPLSGARHYGVAPRSLGCGGVLVIKHELRSFGLA